MPVANLQRTAFLHRYRRASQRIAWYHASTILFRAKDRRRKGHRGKIKRSHIVLVESRRHHRHDMQPRLMDLRRSTAVSFLLRFNGRRGPYLSRNGIPHLRRMEAHLRLQPVSFTARNVRGDLPGPFLGVSLP